MTLEFYKLFYSKKVILFLCRFSTRSHVFREISALMVIKDIVTAFNIWDKIFPKTGEVTKSFLICRDFICMVLIFVDNQKLFFSQKDMSCDCLFVLITTLKDAFCLSLPPLCCFNVNEFYLKIKGREFFLQVRPNFLNKLYGALFKITYEDQNEGHPF